MEPREVCTTVIKQYPSLKMETQCDLIPRETCTPERVQPQLVTRPVIKKICTKTNGETTTEKPKQSKFELRYDLYSITPKRLVKFFYPFRYSNWGKDSANVWVIFLCSRWKSTRQSIE